MVRKRQRAKSNRGHLTGLEVIGALGGQECPRSEMHPGVGDFPYRQVARTVA
jgi:hypothetical protein